jgi:hypothetical protein
MTGEQSVKPISLNSDVISVIANQTAYFKSKRFAGETKEPYEMFNPDPSTERLIKFSKDEQ